MCMFYGKQNQIILLLSLKANVNCDSVSARTPQAVSLKHKLSKRHKIWWGFCKSMEKLHVSMQTFMETHCTSLNKYLTCQETLLDTRVYGGNKPENGPTHRLLKKLVLGDLHLTLIWPFMYMYKTQQWHLTCRTVTRCSLRLAITSALVEAMFSGNAIGL